MSKVKLYSCLICPFAQRSWLYALHYKIDFEYVEFDLYDENFQKIKVKPDWYLKLNPKGEVPVLVDGEESIYESAIINEYIETALNKDESLVLTPKDGLKRAHVKMWKKFFDDKIMSYFYKLLRLEDSKEELLELYQNINTFMTKGYSKYGGEYFIGDEFGEMEYFIAPFLIRYKVVLPALRNINIFDAEEISQFSKYSEKCMKNEVFRASCYDAVPVKGSMKGYYKNHEKYDYETYLIDSYLIYTNKN
eukprot:gene8085-12546_t